MPRPRSIAKILRSRTRAESEQDGELPDTARFGHEPTGSIIIAAVSVIPGVLYCRYQGTSCVGSIVVDM